MHTKKHRLRCTSLLLTVSLFLGLSASPAAADNGTVPGELGGAGKSVTSDYDRNNTYVNYIANYKNEKSPDVELMLPASSIAEVRDNDARVTDYKDGAKNVLDWRTDRAGSWVEWNVTIPQTGLYQMAVSALFPQSNPRDIELGLQIDGKTPFNEAGHQFLSRIWIDDGGINQSSAGHDIRPKPVAQEKWTEYGFRDSEGRYGEDFRFYLTQGTHKIRLTSDDGELLLQYLKIYRKPAAPDYKQMAAVYKEKGYKPAANQTIKVQAENSGFKSSSDLTPIFDRSSSSTEPYNAYKIKLNTIGGQNWKRPGQWISWKLDVPESGMYKVAIKYRQNLLSGLFTSRRLYIDGKVPFSEWEHIRFPFGNDWSMKVPGDKDPELVYLEKGTHELKLEVVLGEISDSINQIDGAIYVLNDLYRRIIMMTSTHPDPYRDYYIDERIPDMVKILRDNGEMLANQAGRLAEVSGKKGNEVALLETISHQLTDIADKPATIATRLDSFKSNVSALASWLMRVKEQPLELDYIELLSPDQKPQPANESFSRKIGRMINQFIASFIVDYDTIGNKDAKAKSSVKVWVGTGRDQASIIKNLIDNYFTPQTGISIDLQLVQGSIIEATLAGKGPDIALMASNAEPVNFALRGALVDLSKFPDFGEVAKRFQASALVPFQFLNGYYAVPETQTYDMMFYRKDVFDELGLKVPDNWDDFYKMIPVIERNNMNIGFNQDMFATFLFQRGGTYYNKSLTRTAFDTPEAAQAFSDLTDMYTRYDFPLTYDFYSRFRTGEMPVAFQPFTQFNLLSVAAPEINGLWDMAPYPGLKKADGTVDRSQHATSTASIMFSKTKDKEAAWQFLKWWTSADMQAKYGKELEILMGPAARYATANMEAFKQLPWAKKERDNIMKQWEHVKGIPEAPGSYYTGVGLTNAFRTATVDHANPFQTLSEWNHYIDDELKRKRIEFGLPTE